MPTATPSSDRPERPRCGARTRLCLHCGGHARDHKPGEAREACTFSAKPCPQRCAKGRPRCRLHGGASLAGLAHPRFRDGVRTFRYSELLHGRLKDLYETFAGEDDLLSTRHQIHLLEGRAAQLLEAALAGDYAGAENVKCWRAVEDARAQLNRAGEQEHLRALASVKLGDAMGALQRSYTALGREQAAWAEIAELHKLLDRLRRTERELQETRYRIFTAEQALAMNRALEIIYKGSLEKHVADAEVRRAVLRAVDAGLGELAARRLAPPAVA